MNGIWQMASPPCWPWPFCWLAEEASCCLWVAQWRPCGLESRKGSDQQPMNKWGLYANNPEGTKSCQQLEWAGKLIHPLKMILWETQRKKVQVSHSQVPNPQELWDSKRVKCIPPTEHFTGKKKKNHTFGPNWSAQWIACQPEDWSGSWIGSDHVLVPCFGLDPQ